jgi:hypothetical protein
MSHLKFFTFQQRICQIIKNKLIQNVRLNNNDIVKLQETIYESKLSKELLQNELNINMTLKNKELDNIDNQLKHLNNRKNIIKNNLNFYVNLEKYLKT